jgi:hypothetical protein
MFKFFIFFLSIFCINVFSQNNFDYKVKSIQLKTNHQPSCEKYLKLKKEIENTNNYYNFSYYTLEYFSNLEELTCTHINSDTIQDQDKVISFYYIKKEPKPVKKNKQLDLTLDFQTMSGNDSEVQFGLQSEYQFNISKTDKLRLKFHTDNTFEQFDEKNKILGEIEYSVAFEDDLAFVTLVQAQKDSVKNIESESSAVLGLEKSYFFTEHLDRDFLKLYIAVGPNFLNHSNETLQSHTISSFRVSLNKKIIKNLSFVFNILFNAPIYSFSNSESTWLDIKNYNIKSEAAFIVDNFILDGLKIKFGIFDEYRNKPAEGKLKNDFKTNTSIGVGFDW